MQTRKRPFSKGYCISLQLYAQVKHFCSFTHQVLSPTSTSRASTHGQRSMGGHVRTLSASVWGLLLPPTPAHHPATTTPIPCFLFSVLQDPHSQKGCFHQNVRWKGPLLVGDSYLLILSLLLTHSSHSASITEFLPCAMCFQVLGNISAQDQDRCPHRAQD